MLENDSQSQAWESGLCVTCPVPGILRANACEHMTLNAMVYRPFFIFKARIRVEAYCTKTHQKVERPHVGCGECHDLPEFFGE
ncbi:MAG: hypothetical protein B6I38_04945 [Anaerolineaceae bacterium 4572_5.1]|nr:MAG: hypothetical protein B6I38_04945 [Anaerolineaceae bacterium 4572_5.1]